MPPLIPLPGQHILPSGRAYVETPAWRHLREQDELEVARRGWIAEPEAANTEPNPSEAPEVPSAPASAYGIGTYDAFHAGYAEAFAEIKGKIKDKSKGKSKGKSKDKSKGKSKGKPKGKDRGSRSDPTHSAWQGRDFWRYDSA